MSARPIAPSPALARLLRDGYEAEVRGQFLLVHQVPYVDSTATVRRGVIICEHIESAGTLMPPLNHQVWFQGDAPCLPDGSWIAALGGSTAPVRMALGDDLVANFQFSNKPDGLGAFAGHVEKILHYVELLEAQARAIDPSADARTGRVLPSTPQQSVFRYADTAAARAGVLAACARLKMRQVHIIGLGGTGAYVLDQVAKTPVEEVHLHDGDVLEQHNAFRAPGAASIAELEERMFKTDYFRRKYDPMHQGIVSHAQYVDAANIGQLAGADFVFVCVDKGAARRLICEYLCQRRIPFIDVGMGVDQDSATGLLDGTCRVTLCTPDQDDHLGARVPFDDDDREGIYRQQIQVADLNAMNALLAVVKWKQVVGFYADAYLAHHVTFTVSTGGVARDVMRASAT